MSKEDLIPFKKGESGNPAGRPKGSRNRNTTVKELFELATKQKNAITGVEETLTQERAITIAIIVKAIKGDVNAYKALMDSCYGAPVQQIEQTNIEQPLFTLNDNNDSDTED